jgi:simple sugar transport system ATP-binding protein
MDVMTVLKLQGVSKNFGAIQALHDISLAIEAGEVVGLMGDNGAGKSTLVKIVAGNYPPSKGSIRIADRQVALQSPADARAQGIEIVYQELALCDNLTAAANVFLGRELMRSFGPFRILDYRTMYQRAGALFAELKSETRPRDLVRRMSGGQRQAVAIARTRLSEPVALVSHRMPDVFAVADRVVVLRRGTKVADKPTSKSSPEEVTGLITGAIQAA